MAPTKKKSSKNLTRLQRPPPTTQQGWLKEQMDKATDNLDAMKLLHDLMDDPKVRTAIALYRKFRKEIET